MKEIRHIGYLLCLALLIGLAMVQLRTRHIQAISRITAMSEQEQQWRQMLQQQQLRLSGVLESPQTIKKQIEQMEIEIVPPGTEEVESEG
ncbi:MAG: hypothetical protein KAT56_00150 [Sedimentisphaerales bacterium]|nr:hypothetical protein [Sedimentisphaerales bacterium]